MTTGAGRQAVATLIGLAVLITLINAIKPVHIDDTYFLRLAAHIREHPTDPFGFMIFWQQLPMHAFDNYVPPLLPYWLAFTGMLVGDEPFVLKLALLPFAMLLTFAVYQLCRRIAPEIALPVTSFIVISPTLFPGWNMMLDLPSTALGLAAVVAALSAIDREDIKLAAIAALLAGAAALTKFTALVYPGVIALYSLRPVVKTDPMRSMAFAVAIGLFVLAVLVFWEFVHYLLYGHTQLLWGFLQGGTNAGNAGSLQSLASGFVATTGALLLLLLPFFLPTAGGRGFFTAALACTVTVILMYVVAALTGWMTLLFLLAGLVLIGAATVCMATVCTTTWLARRKPDPITLFLIGWLLLELIAYFIISPFPATRRLIGSAVVLTLLGCRLLLGSIQADYRRNIVRGCWLLVAGNAGLSATYFYTDFLEADAQKTIVREAAAHIRQAGGDEQIWYLGHWGFAYYAEQLGLSPIVPGFSQLGTGDWIIQPERVHSQVVQAGPGRVNFIGSLTLEDQLPLQTLPVYYSGQVPMRVKPDNVRIRAHLYRSAKDQVLE